MLQFRHRGGRPALAHVLETFALDAGDVDAEYGVVATDPRDDLYVVRVGEGAAGKLRAALAARPADGAEGLFGDARVESTAPPGA